MYGYEMIDTLRKRSENVFELKAGTLYPPLKIKRYRKYLRCKISQLYIDNLYIIEKYYISNIDVCQQNIKKELFCPKAVAETE